MSVSRSEQNPIPGPPVVSTTLHAHNTASDVVPGYPFISDSEVDSFLSDQLLTRELDELSSWLWLVASPNSTHIAALHEQAIRGREIVITEKARLHLLWYRNRIFIKPLPAYLLDSRFREAYVTGKTELEAAVAGFLRSYTLLIQGPADLSIAIEKKLLPCAADSETGGQNDVDVREILTFLSQYVHSNISDDGTSRRFRYGDLRLTRINFWNRVRHFQLYYQKVHTNYSDYFGRFMEPFLFIFGTTSVILSAMQVVLGALQGNNSAGPTWQVFLDTAKWFSVASIALVVAVVLGLCMLGVVLLLREARYAITKSIRRKLEKRDYSDRIGTPSQPA